MATAKTTSFKPASLAFAKQLFQTTTDSFGPEEVEQGLGVRVTEGTVPALPFSESLLTRAKKLGFFLVFQADRSADGAPITMEYLCECWRRKWPSSSYIFENILAHRREPFFSELTPRFGWRLISRELVKGTFGWKIGYIEQSLNAAWFLQELYFEEKMPDEYARVIKELKELQSLVSLPTSLEGDATREAIEHYLSMDFTRHFRENPAEFLYRLLLARAINQKPLLPVHYTLTNAQVCGTYLVVIGGDDTMAPRIELYDPRRKRLNYRLGLCLSLG